MLCDVDHSYTKSNNSNRRAARRNEEMNIVLVHRRTPLSVRRLYLLSVHDENRFVSIFVGVRGMIFCVCYQGFRHTDSIP